MKAEALDLAAVEAEMQAKFALDGALKGIELALAEAHNGARHSYIHGMSWGVRLMAERIAVLEAADARREASE